MGSGVEGYSVVRFASETLGLGLAAQRHAAAFFGEGLAKRLVAFTKQTLNADAREALRKRIEGDREKNPVGARRMPIVDVEVDVKDLGIPPDEAQFLEQREFGVEEVARWFRMQLAKIQYFKRAQGWSSLDALNTDYVVDFLTRRSRRGRRRSSQAPDGGGARPRASSCASCSRGCSAATSTARIAYYSAGYRDGWLSQNDIRDLEDMNPIEDPAADEYRVQAQMTKLEDAGAKPKDPAAAPPANRPAPRGRRRTRRRRGAAIRAEAEALRPMLLHAATLLARKEAHEVAAALKKNGSNPAALDQWARGFYPRLRERVVEAFQPAGFAIDVIAARHPAARVRPADLDAVARAWTAVDLRRRPPDRGGARRGARRRRSSPPCSARPRGDRPCRLTSPTRPSASSPTWGSGRSCPSYLQESLAAIRYRPLAAARAGAARRSPASPSPTDVQAEGLMPPPLSYFVTSEGVGILPLHGPSMKARSKYGGYSTVDARRQLRAMAADERVGAILLHIDSPGGHVAGTKELADDVAAVGQTKPVHAYIEDTGASAAYWVASQARTVAANAMAMVGSLGTFTVLYDLSRMAEMEGVQVHVVSTGERKGAAVPGTPVTDGDLAEAQRLVDGFDALLPGGRPAGPRARGEGCVGRVDRGRLARGRGEGARARGPGRDARRGGRADHGAAAGEGGEGAAWKARVVDILAAGPTIACAHRRAAGAACTLPLGGTAL